MKNRYVSSALLLAAIAFPSLVMAAPQQRTEPQQIVAAKECMAEYQGSKTQPEAFRGFMSECVARKLGVAIAQPTTTSKTTTTTARTTTTHAIEAQAPKTVNVAPPATLAVTATPAASLITRTATGGTSSSSVSPANSGSSLVEVTATPDTSLIAKTATANGKPAPKKHSAPQSN